MHKSVLSVQYRDCSNTIQRLLGERAQIAKELINTHRLVLLGFFSIKTFVFFSSSLSTLNEMTLNNTRKHYTSTPKFDLIQLSSYLQILTLSIFTSMLIAILTSETFSPDHWLMLSASPCPSPGLPLPINKHLWSIIYAPHVHYFNHYMTHTDIGINFT